MLNRILNLVYHLVMFSREAYLEIRKTQPERERERWRKEESESEHWEEKISKREQEGFFPQNWWWFPSNECICLIRSFHVSLAFTLTLRTPQSHWHVKSVSLFFCYMWTSVFVCRRFFCYSIFMCRWVFSRFKTFNAFAQFVSQFI